MILIKHRFYWWSEFYTAATVSTLSIWELKVHNTNDFDMLQWLLQFASKIYIDIYLSSRNIVGTPNNELCTEDVGL